MFKKITPGTILPVVS